MRSVSQAAACALPAIECAAFQAPGSPESPDPLLGHAATRLAEAFAEHFPEKFGSPLPKSRRNAFGFYLLDPSSDDAWLSAAGAFAADFDKADIGLLLPPCPQKYRKPLF